jgi:hypothetical protein
MKRDLKAFSLAFIILLLGVVSMLMAVVWDRTGSTVTLNKEMLFRQQAKYMSQSGVALALSALARDPDFAENFTVDTFPHVSEDVKFEVKIDNNFAGTTVIQAQDGSDVPPGMVYVASSGQVADAKLYVEAGLAGLVKPSNSGFKHSLLGLSQVSVSGGSLLDAYDSALAPYTPYDLMAAPRHTSGVASAGAEGSVAIELSGGSRVDGDLTTARNGGAVSVLDSAWFSGDQEQSEAPPIIPDFQFEFSGPVSDITIDGVDTPLAPGEYGDVTVSNANLSLQPGTYYFQSLTVSSGGVLVDLNGGSDPTEVYLLTGADLSDALVNPTEPEDVFRLHTRSGDIAIRNGSEFHGVAAGKRSNIAVEGSEVFGALVGDHVSVSGSQVHFNEELGRKHFQSLMEWRVNSVREETRAEYVAGQSTGGCFIATAAYGTPLAQEVKVLSRFRDNHLLTNRPGRALVAFYYRVSPPIADIIAERPPLRFLTRAALYPLVSVVEQPWRLLGLVPLLALTALWRRRRQAQRRGPRERGTLLLESLIGLVLFATVTVAYASMMEFTYATSSAARRTATAQNIGASVLEEFRTAEHSWRVANAMTSYYNRVLTVNSAFNGRDLSTEYTITPYVLSYTELTPKRDDGTALDPVKLHTLAVEVAFQDGKQERKVELMTLVRP